MKLTGPACTEAMNEAEEDGTRERAEDNAGGVRVELGVRPSAKALKKERISYQELKIVRGSTFSFLFFL